VENTSDGYWKSTKIDVEQDMPFEQIAFPDVGCTGGMGPCIGVGIYCKKLNKGFLIHISTPSNPNQSDDQLNKMCKAAVDAFKDQRIEILVAGGEVMPDEDGDTRFSDDKRASVLFIIKKYFPRHKAIVNWTEVADSTALTTIDTVMRRMNQEEVDF